jgi:lipopolysaccharide export system protein LptC
VSLVSYLRERRLTVAIVLVGLAAAASQGLMWWLSPQAAEHDFVGPPRSGYTLHHFTMWSYGVDGLPSFSMTSPQLDRHDEDDTLYIITPNFVIPSKQPGVLPDWDGHSLYGWVDKSGTLIKLQGPVYMHRPAYVAANGTPTPVTTLNTSEATLWPKENRMETAEAAHVVQGERTMTGIGMRANLNENHLELLDASHITFPPRAPKPSPGQPAPARHAPVATGAGQAR